MPLLVDEPGSERAGALWDEATRVVSARLVYPEARAALAAAQTDGRISAAGLRRAVGDLGQLVDQLDIVELTEELALRAGQLAEAHGLRGYDAVHVATAEELASDELVVVAGDAAMLRACGELGFATAATR